MSDAACRNCGAALAGRWCHACGQDGVDPFSAPQTLFVEWLDAVWGWDSRLLRTLRLLLGRPGALPGELVAGRRARYVGPLRLYLVVSAAFFASYSLTPDPVLALIAGLGDLERGWAMLASIDRWLPTLMIVILPCTALVLWAAFRAPPRGFLQHLLFALLFGTASFLTVVAAQLLGIGLRALGAGSAAMAPLLLAHGYNTCWLFLGARRFYGLGLGATTWRLAFGVAAMVVVLAWTAGLAMRVVAAAG